MLLRLAAAAASCRAADAANEATLRGSGTGGPQNANRGLPAADIGGLSLGTADEAASRLFRFILELLDGTVMAIFRALSCFFLRF